MSQLLIKKGAELPKRLDQYLVNASKNDEIETARFLIDRGAKPTYKIGRKISAIDFAISDEMKQLLSSIK